MAKTYTTQQYIKKLQSISIKDIKPFYEATNEIIIKQDERIFNKGVDANGTAIGKYDTKPVYISLKYTPRKFAPKGKNGETKFKNGKMHKSGYFEGGYYQFKQAIGKASAGSNVNLWLFGHFRRGFQNSANPAKATKQGFEIVYSVRHSEANSAGKLEGIIDRYGHAFKLSKSERAYILKKFTEIFVKELIK